LIRQKRPRSFLPEQQNEHHTKILTQHQGEAHGAL